MHDPDVLTEVEIALSIVKRVEREARMGKQALGRLRDRLQTEEVTSNHDDSNDDARAA